MNKNKWKKVSKAKKFREEFEDPEEGFSDFFRIGISYNKGSIKLYEQFYKSDIIIGKLYHL